MSSENANAGHLGPEPTTNGTSEGPKGAIRRESSGWLPAVDGPPADDATQRERKSKSPTPTRENAGATSLRRTESRRSLFTNQDGQPIEGAPFITTGAGTSGPYSNAKASEELESRAASAEESLSSRQRSKIAKLEAKEGKRLSKIIKNEGRTEKRALDVAINELAGLQQMQASLVKNEADAYKSRSKVQTELQKEEARLLDARAKHEAAQAHLAAEDEKLEIIKNKTKEATEKLQEKSQEVDSLRRMLGVDERERAQKLAECTGKSDATSPTCVVS
ncbi:putative DNA binding protein Ncp1 [Lyophyllum shimeji]|uniref:DNA binding protein Ncp1 n=1 Tax=Lyophyllum shimeji TaxID=47721 RepID=A0A9P3UMF3_LYOSH|nr:putative DNA binding protein Ncp1 [Lyophyllum shimeji]